MTSNDQDGKSVPEHQLLRSQIHVLLAPCVRNLPQMLHYKTILC